MKPLTLEWVAKAEADYSLARRELAAGEASNFDAVCFHAQQAAEKYIKACLQEQDTSFTRLHDLNALAGLLAFPLPELNALQTELIFLSQMAVSTRYPGYFADVEAARQAVAIAAEVRRICREVLGMEE